MLTDLLTQVITLLTLLHRRFKAEPGTPPKLRALVPPLRLAARALNLSLGQEEAVETLLHALAAATPVEAASTAAAAAAAAAAASTAASTADADADATATADADADADADAAGGGLDGPQPPRTVQGTGRASAEEFPALPEVQGTGHSAPLEDGSRRCGGVGVGGGVGSVGGVGGGRGVGVGVAWGAGGGDGGSAGVGAVDRGSAGVSAPDDWRSLPLFPTHKDLSGDALVLPLELAKSSYVIRAFGH